MYKKYDGSGDPNVVPVKEIESESPTVRPDLEATDAVDQPVMRELENVMLQDLNQGDVVAIPASI